jgi:hypothetical protein
MALAWAAGSSMGELSLLAQHHVNVLAAEVRHLQIVEDHLLDEMGREECPDVSDIGEASSGLQTWEKVTLGAVLVVVVLAAGALLWLSMMLSAATANAEALNSIN